MLRRIETVVCVSIIVLSAGLMMMSYCWGIAYARGPFFFVLTNGYFVVPWPLFQSQVWGDWGWWAQSPWLDEWSQFGFPHLFPEIGSVRQINGLGLHLSLFGPAFLAVFWLTIRRIEELNGRALKALSLSGWLVFLLCFDLNQTHFFAYRLVPTLVWEHTGTFLWPLIRITGVIAVCVSVPGSLVLMNRVKAQRKQGAGLCAHCRYDLRGNTSGRCPECGTSIAGSGD